MKLFQVNIEQDRQHVRELFWEYLQWANQNVNEAFNVSFDIAAMLENDMQTLGKFLPPDGRLLLAETDEQIAGLACMKRLTGGMCEVKRMYVRPAFRSSPRSALLLGLIDEAKQMGYATMRPDSARFRQRPSAVSLYRIQGNEARGQRNPWNSKHWVFMELPLA
jgi:GNAT superfamily N-acetyltransferase